MDIINIITWWLMFFVIGIINLPVTFLIFNKFSDIGYSFSKILGSLILSYLVFILGFTLGINIILVISCLAVMLLVNLVIFRKSSLEIKSKLKSSLPYLIIGEILFSFGLFFWSYIRSFQPDINGLEKFMDIGFINSILRSSTFPPKDMWFAGESINYYWFGHHWAATLTRLSMIPSTITFNLLLATIMGLLLSGTFSIVSTLVKLSSNKSTAKTIIASGLISAILITFAGNFHTPYFVFKKGFEGIKSSQQNFSFPSNLYEVFSLGATKYWYPDATRFIGYNPETNDKTIHEFPLYSFVVSDLHAHLINLPFVILYIGLLLSYLTNDSKRTLRRVFPLGFILSILFMTSAWDFGNYSIVTGFIFMFSFLSSKQKSFRSLSKTLAEGLLLLGIAFLISLPFIANFESIAEGVGLVKSRSFLWQLSLLWGFPVILTLLFVIYLLVNIISGHAKSKKRGRVSSSGLFKKLVNSLFTAFENSSKSDLFIASLLIGTWILILLPEFIYLKDIYEATHHRANTMFKLTYQGFVMSYLSSGYIIYRLLNIIQKKAVKIGVLTFIIIVVSSIMIYPSIAIRSYYGDIKNYKGLAGDEWINSLHPDEYDVINWMNKNIKDQPTILEAPGDSYTEFNIISTFTGLPTISGWFVHEWLWRGSPDFPQKRVTDITTIYESEDVDLTLKLISAYNVEYIIVGKNERTRFPNINEDKFLEIGTSAYSSGKTTVYKLHK